MPVFPGLRSSTQSRDEDPVEYVSWKCIRDEIGEHNRLAIHLAFGDSFEMEAFLQLCGVHLHQ